ncbi:MarR family transcriptional regulator [Tomitella fengzijianii]|uniref:MarR family transcriptional regulator n=2 Tax=Tomitella fengzijianii TaxID=2597660 RepID=A0A516X7F1_9ACTN|nr:MarR family transcriptional regulator [Tomitella fengzijianii]
MRERTMTQVGRFGADGMELAAYRCVFALLQNGPMRSGELAETLLSDPSTVSRHVAQLVDRGHLERRSDPDDRRASMIAVTESGRQAAERMRLRRNQRLGAVVGSWPEGERAELARLLGKLLDGYE